MRSKSRFAIRYVSLLSKLDLFHSTKIDQHCAHRHIFKHDDQLRAGARPIGRYKGIQDFSNAFRLGILIPTAVNSDLL